VLWGILHLTPGFQKRIGQFTYRSLSDLEGVAHPTTKLAVAALVRTKWFQVSQPNQRQPVTFKLVSNRVPSGEEELQHDG
jgi:hypothetical protein